MLLELLIAIIVLAIGMGGILILLVSAMYTNNRSGNDTTSTMAAEHIIEQISSQAANAGGNGAAMTSTGAVDWTQGYSGVPAGYAMQYIACGAAAQQITYDIRWNAIALNATNNSSRMIVVSARPSGSPTVGGLRYVIPVNLRTIGGMP